MIVEQVWTGNAYRNFNYVIACPETGEALAIDPLDFGKCLTVANDMGWRITQILNTHEHGDHIGGNKGMVAATGAKIIAHTNAAGRIPDMDRGVRAGDVIKVGTTVELECLDTPGHTMSHICLLSHTDCPALFSGDTLFNAGAGNCHNGGHPEELYETFDRQLSKLREPDNQVAQRMIHDYEDQDPADALVTTLAQEHEMNTFFRLDSPARLKEDFPEIGDDPDPRTVFLKLRELRNSW
jgi:hydroxyacylglutathione hydrolase